MDPVFAQKLCEGAPKTMHYTLSPVAYSNLTILSSTHCSAPSAWSFRGNIIGFFCILAEADDFSYKKYLSNRTSFFKEFEPPSLTFLNQQSLTSTVDDLHHRLINFSDIFSVFVGYTDVISDFDLKMVIL